MTTCRRVPIPPRPMSLKVWSILWFTGHLVTDRLHHAYQLHGPPYSWSYSRCATPSLSRLTRTGRAIQVETTGDVDESLLFKSWANLGSLNGAIILYLTIPPFVLIRLRVKMYVRSVFVCCGTLVTSCNYKEIHFRICSTVRNVY